jgi:hypothetical protein
MRMTMSRIAELRGVFADATIADMSIEQIVAALVAERDKLNRAIEALGGGSSVGKRRGRPPKALAGGTETGNPHVAKRKGRPL